MTVNVTLRNVKGSPLTHTEMDNNFTSIKNEFDALAATDSTVLVGGQTAEYLALNAGRFVLQAVTNIKDFGAIGDGSADDTAALLSAIASLPGGGRILVPSGWYRVTATLPLHSGLIFIGDGCTNLTFGTPSNNERPSHIFIDSDTLPLFNHAFGVQMESVSFENISFGARLFPTTVARGTTKCFDLQGSWPVDIKHLTFTSCQFANFDKTFYINDPAAPSANPDWNVAPVTMTDCTFYYTNIGIMINADNADCWVLTNTAFFLNSGQIGIDVVRGGYIKLISCFGGGGSMLKTTGSIRDQIVFDTCQYEAATAMLWVTDTMATEQTYRSIKFISCIVEAPVIIQAPCHFISEGSRYVDNIEVTSSGVKIDSLFDTFLASTSVNLAAGSFVDNFLTNGGQLPAGVRGQILNGTCIRYGDSAPAIGVGLVGDIQFNKTPELGEPSQWHCIASGNPGEWHPSGQVGFRSVAGTPVSALTPKFVGEEVLNTLDGTWWKSVGDTINSWTQIG